MDGRIASAFDLIESNPLHLAVPLARLALARRAAEEEETEATETALAGQPEFSAVVVPASESDIAAEVEQGSAEEPEDLDIARLPRPRPGALGEDSSAEEDGPAEAVADPLDLVAAAAPSATEEQPILLAAVAASDTGSPAEAPQPAAAPAAPMARELVAAGACTPPEDVTDKDDDFSRNAGTFAAGGLCISETELKERDKRWIVQTVATGRPGPVWAILHDDEDSSFDKALQALGTYGGTLITVETGGRRLLEGIDPNRNFSADGIGCEKLGEDATPQFTMMFRGLFDPSQPIIALHNKSDEKIRGHGHASMSSLGKGMRASPAPDPDGPLAGEDTLVLLASTKEEDAAVDAATKALNEQGVNVVRELVRTGKGDCSFSNYVLLSGHPGYFNVTVGKDAGDKQRKIVDAIMAGRPAAVATQ